VPEILEQVLSHSDTFDILNVSMTCQALKHIIDASPELKPDLLLKPQRMVVPQKIPSTGPSGHLRYPDSRSSLNLLLGFHQTSAAYQ
jgi:hypothetical protein